MAKVSKLSWDVWDWISKSPGLRTDKMPQLDSFKGQPQRGHLKGASVAPDEHHLQWSTHQLSPVEGKVVYPTIYRVLVYIPSGCLGFLKHHNRYVDMSVNVRKPHKKKGETNQLRRLNSCCPLCWQGVCSWLRTAMGAHARRQKWWKRSCKGSLLCTFFMIISQGSLAMTKILVVPTCSNNIFLPFGRAFFFRFQCICIFPHVCWMLRVQSLGWISVLVMWQFYSELLVKKRLINWWKGYGLVGFQEGGKCYDMFIYFPRR